MWSVPDLNVSVAALRRSGWGAEAIRLALFLAVEQVTQVCRHRLEASLPSALGAATQVTAAAVLMIWAFLAHERLAFRFRNAIGAFFGLGPFVVVSWACLDLQMLALDVLPRAALGVAFVIGVVKFVVIRARVWPPISTMPAR